MEHLLFRPSINSLTYVIYDQESYLNDRQMALIDRHSMILYPEDSYEYEHKFNLIARVATRCRWLAKTYDFFAQACNLVDISASY